MMDGDEMLVFYRLDLDLMVFIGRFGLQSRKRHTTAADDGIPQGVDHVAADGADIQFGAKQIGGSVLIDDSIALHEFHDRDPQGSGKRFKERDIRQPFGGLPLGNGLAADIDLICKFCLRHLFLLPQLLDGVAGDISVHEFGLLYKDFIEIIAGGVRLHNLRSVDMQPGAAEKIGGFMETDMAKPGHEPPDPPEESRCKVIPFERVG